MAFVWRVFRHRGSIGYFNEPDQDLFCVRFIFNHGLAFDHLPNYGFPYES